MIQNVPKRDRAPIVLSYAAGREPQTVIFAGCICIPGVVPGAEPAPILLVQRKIATSELTAIVEEIDHALSQY